MRDLRKKPMPSCLSSLRTVGGRGKLAALTCFALLTNSLHCRADLDSDGNLLSDVWQKKFLIGALPGSADTDGDGFSNANECLFATNPSDPKSHPELIYSMGANGLLVTTWSGEAGKIYNLQSGANLTSWNLYSSRVGTGAMLSENLIGAPGSSLFARVGASDIDTDGDGLSDWEELVSGFNPNRIYSEGLGTIPSTTDKQRLASMLSAATNTVTVTAADSGMSESWPDSGRFVIRRAGNLNALMVPISFGGTATNGADYAVPPTVAYIPFGADEFTVNITPLTDAEVESPETVTLTVATGSGYVVGTAATATLQIADAVPGKPSSKPAARFLTQATLGPSPVEVARVVNLGFSAWLEDQFTRAPNLHLPIVQVWQAELLPVNNSPLVSTEHRLEAWWRQAMRNDASSDPLRQRMAFALSQIFVISDRMDTLASDQRGMAAYYDILLENAFGTYRQLLEGVTRNPWMGYYLSAMKNRKAKPSANRFPDENYAREVMQLFSIGLWRLNLDGTQYLSNGSDRGPDNEIIPAGQPIPSYGQAQVSEIARVFTGLSYSKRFVSATDPTQIPTTVFYDNNNVNWQPMRMFDAEHDLAAKSVLLPGASQFTTSARTASSPDTGTAGDADLAAFLDYLAGHPNVPPFISRLLIQRLVTSNPTPAYIGRVAAVFVNNGSNVRGDMKAVIRAILLDSEARDYSRLSVASHGLVREPYTRYIAMARALEAAPADVSAGGRYRGFGSLDSDFLQRPLSAPSVFNFYSPANQPAGPLRDAGLSSPEMQIINSVSAITGPNRYSTGLSVTNQTLNTATIPTNSGYTQLNPSSVSDNTGTPENEYTWNTRINETKWLNYATTNPAALDPDAMVAALDEQLCYGNMSQPTFRAITRALNRLDNPFASGITATVRDQRIRARLRNAIHLITTSADFAVLK